MKKLILLLLAYLALSGCTYCKHCRVNNSERIKADMDKTFNAADTQPAK